METITTIPDFDTMADEAFIILDKESISSIKAQRMELPNYDIKTETTKLHWKNVKDFMIKINRSPDHFMEFLMKENSGKEVSWMSSSKADGLQIHGKYLKQKLVMDQMEKYISMYVKCPSCRRYNTTIDKSPVASSYFLCQDCGFDKHLG